MLHLPRHRRQEGVALYITSMVLALCALLALWAFRSALFLELIGRNHMDYQRAFEAAYAMLEDAKADIALHLQNEAQAYTRTSATHFLPTNSQQWVAWLATLPDNTTAYCSHGVCHRSTEAENFWSNAQILSGMQSSGARYGNYSGSGNASTDHPILSAVGTNQGAWYWIEPAPVQASHTPWEVHTPALDDAATQDSMLFKITAIALGRKAPKPDATASQPSPTMAVLQTAVIVPLQSDATHHNGYAPVGPMRTLYWRQMR